MKRDIYGQIGSLTLERGGSCYSFTLIKVSISTRCHLTRDTLTNPPSLTTWDVIDEGEKLVQTSQCAAEPPPHPPTHFPRRYFAYRWINLHGRIARSQRIKGGYCVDLIERGVRLASFTRSVCSAEEQSSSWFTLLFIHERKPGEADSFVLHI